MKSVDLRTKHKWSSKHFFQNHAIWVNFIELQAEKPWNNWELSLTIPEMGDWNSSPQFKVTFWMKSSCQIDALMGFPITQPPSTGLTNLFTRNRRTEKTFICFSWQNIVPYLHPPKKQLWNIRIFFVWNHDLATGLVRSCQESCHPWVGGLTVIGQYITSSLSNRPFFVAHHVGLRPDIPYTRLSRVAPTCNSKLSTAVSRDATFGRTRPGGQFHNPTREFL